MVLPLTLHVDVLSSVEITYHCNTLLYRESALWIDTSPSIPSGTWVIISNISSCNKIPVKVHSLSSLNNIKYFRDEKKKMQGVVSRTLADNLGWNVDDTDHSLVIHEIIEVGILKSNLFSYFNSKLEI